MLRLFVVNLLLAVLWPAFSQSFTAVNLLIGFLIGIAILSLFEREYGRRALLLLGFSFYVLWQIIKSNLVLAWFLIQREPDFDQAIIAIPLQKMNVLELTILATVITLTPGTLTVDWRASNQEDAPDKLFVHSMFGSDREAFRRDIKENFERRILRITRGQTEAITESDYTEDGHTASGHVQAEGA